MNKIKPETLKDIELLKRTMKLVFLCEHVLDISEEAENNLQTQIDDIKSMYIDVAEEIGEGLLKELIIRV